MEYFGHRNSLKDIIPLKNSGLKLFWVQQELKLRNYSFLLLLFF